jgi:hypothetical protein
MESRCLLSLFLGKKLFELLIQRALAKRFISIVIEKKLSGRRSLSPMKLDHAFSVIIQPLDLCVFGLCKMLYKGQAKTKRMNGETLKLYRATQALCESPIIPIVMLILFLSDFPSIRKICWRCSR